MKILLLVTSLLLGLTASGRAQEPPPAGLTIEIRNLVASEGDVLIALFDSAEAYDKRTPALRSVVLPVDTEAREWRVDDLAPGEYAVAVYQDLNGNRTLDKGRLGIPKEPYGFSNGAQAAFGPPSFEKARFSYDGHSASLEIRLRQR